MRRLPRVVLFVVLAACSDSPIAVDGGVDASPDAGPPPAGPPAPVSIERISVYQTVQVTLVDEGATATPNAPVVAGRAMQVRVGVTPEGDFVGTVEGRLTLSRGDEEVVFLNTAEIDGPETDRPGFGFGFDVPAAWATSDVSYAVSMHTAEGGGGAGSRFPAAEFQALGVVDAPSIEVHIVPLRYNADGSGRLPSAAEGAGLETLREHLEALLPTNNLVLEVVEPVDLDDAVVGSSSASWSDALRTVQQARAANAPSAHVYYLGLVEPAPSFGEFCSGNCTTGFGTVNENNTPTARSAVALGFDRDSSRFSALHELGHNFGLRHAPCGSANGPDPDFPHGEGSIGVWGLDQRTGGYLPPATADVMGYCRLQWISDYNYNNIYERVAEHGDGDALIFALPHVRITVSRFAAPARNPAELEVPARVEEGGVLLDAFDAAGAPAGQVIAHRQELSAPEIVQWLVPLVEGVASVALPGGRVALR